MSDPTIDLSLSHDELILLIQHLGENLIEKAHRGEDTNDLPETNLRLRFITAIKELDERVYRESTKRPAV